MAKSVYQVGQIHELRGELAEAEEAYRRSLALDLALQNVPDLIIDYSNLAFLAITKGDWPAVPAHFAQALGLALQVNPYPAFQTAGRMRDAAGRLLAAGQAAAAADMAAAGLQVVEQMQGRLRGDKQQAAALCGAVLAAIRLAALGQRDQALALARQVNKGHRWAIQAGLLGRRAVGRPGTDLTGFINLSGLSPICENLRTLRPALLAQSCQN